jgi:hypothetical protein
MPTPKIRSSAGALAGAAAVLWLTPAYPHAVCGDRIFPSTQAIDDPGVTDELTLPSVAWLPKNPDGAQELDIGAEWAKTIFPNFAISAGGGSTWLHPGGYGWDALDTEAKYQFMCIPQLELMASAGFDVEWGGSATGSQVGEPNMYSPVLDVGLGFGALPMGMNFLRPFAVTGEVSTTTPGQALWGGEMFPTTFNWGFSLQYSLPYYNANVGEIGADFFKHLIPTVEFAFSTPTAHAEEGTWGTTGTIQPGVVYMADKWQIAVEAVIPVNGASGHGAGVVASLDLFLDDIFPNSIGKPIFSQTLPMFTGAR